SPVDRMPIRGLRNTGTSPRPQAASMPISRAPSTMPCRRSVSPCAISEPAKPMNCPGLAAAEYGMTADMLAKNDLVIDGGLRSLEICKRAGVPVGYGTDLLGALQVEESREFILRSEVLSPIEIIRQATTIGARIVRQEGKIG